MNSKELCEQDVEAILKKQNTFFATGITKDLYFRKKQLYRLKKGIQKYEKKITLALREDLGKHQNESYMTEIGYVYSSITHAMKHLEFWARPRRKKTPIYLMPACSYVINEPYGSVLIIGPYNYPFQLLIEPLIGAIAAGNTAVIKPSEMSSHVSAVVKEMLDELFSEEYIACVEGDVETVTSLINSKFDYIFFTGSTNVGKIVMQAAAKNLIPVTLELGGKSPVIVDESANIKEAAKRIIWGKTINAGQTCVAPDFVLVQESVKDQLIMEMQNAIIKFFGKDASKSDSFCRIINEKHFHRLKTILEKDQEYIIYGGNTEKANRYIGPTLLDLPSVDAASMQEELFGPILPILTYHSLNGAIETIRKMSKPLALYLFTRRRSTEAKVLRSISSGGVSINDTIMHITNPYLPFGGVGASGMGSYHGEESYRTFSHRKSILKKNASVNNTVAYPSFTERQLKLVRMIFK